MKSLRRSLGDKNKDGSGHAHSPFPSGATSPHITTMTAGGSSAFASSTAPLSKPSHTIAPPQKVIRARQAHVSGSPQELSFAAGDFFYCTGEKGLWFEALNTVTNARGLVPKAKFEEFSRGGAKAEGSRTSSHSSQPSTSSRPGAPAKGAGGPPTPLYAIVQYDFEAERPDELQAKAGEPIIVIAQSNHEWFVAKPIGRLGGPGLIPVSFVEIRDPVTGRPVEDVQELLRAGGIPRVDEWKQKTAEYKAASIPLGRFEFTGPGVADSPFAKGGGPASSSSSAAAAAGQQQSKLPQRYQQSDRDLNRPPSVVEGHLQDQQQRAYAQQVQQQRRSSEYSNQHPSSSQYQQPQQQQHAPRQDAYQNSGRGEDYTDEDTTSGCLPPGTFTSASVVSFHNEQDQYWFRIHANFLPENPSELSYRLILFRVYEDFYHFQIALLDAFPAEAGRPPYEGAPAPERILPYMPGPLDHVDDQITNERLDDLDMYLRDLIGLHRVTAGYVLSHELVRNFFNPGPGDHQTELPRRDLERELLAEQEAEPLQSAGATGTGGGGNSSTRSSVADPGGLSMSALNIQGDDSRREDLDDQGREERISDDSVGRGAGGRGYPSHQSQRSFSGGYGGGGGGGGDGGGRGGRGGSTAGSSRGPSPLPRIDTNVRGGGGPVPGDLYGKRPPSDYTSAGQGGTAGTSSSWGSNAGGAFGSSSVLSPLTTSASAGAAGFPRSDSQQTTMSTRSTGGASGAAAAGGSAAYKKIKVFDRATDDLIAIRVPSNVTYDQLVDKIQDRLGGDRRRLQYRTSQPGVGSGQNQLRMLGSDGDLLDWMEREDKLVLYAE